MFQTQFSQPTSAQPGRPKRIRQTSNRLFLFEYSSSRSKQKNKNQWDLAETKYEKSATYLLKKQEQKQKRKEMMESNNQMDHRSNIDRLISLISKSRTFVKNNDSGCEKMVRALSRLLYSIHAMKGGFESLKKFTMTCSSHNYELFIQSKHQMRETVKLKTSEQELELEQIAENADQNALNGQYSKNSKQIQNELFFQKENKENSISFNFDSPQKFNDYSTKGYITTQEDLSLEGYQSPIKKMQQIKGNSSKPMKLCFAKTRSSAIFQNNPLDWKFTTKDELAFPSAPSEPHKIYPSTAQSPTQSQCDQIQLLFSQVAFLFHKTSSPRIEDKKISGRASPKCNSPIYNLLYSIPVSNPSQNSKLVQEAADNKSRPKILKKESKKEGILTSSQYAEKMLFGEPIKQQIKVEPIRNPLMQEANLRRRANSLPKITFTYTSRQKYEKQCSPEMKDSIFPITIYKKRQLNNREPSSKNTSKDQLQTTFSSKQTEQRTNPRFGQKAPQQSQYHMPGVIKCPVRHHKIAVSPRMQDKTTLKSSHNPSNLIAPMNLVRNQYYGDPNSHLKRMNLMNQALENRKERIITAQPGWENDVEFAGPEKQIPNCCWATTKQVRSRSLNDRVLINSGLRNQF